MDRKRPQVHVRRDRGNFRHMRSRVGHEGGARGAGPSPGQTERVRVQPRAVAACCPSFARGRLGGGSRWTEKLFHGAEKVSTPRLKITCLCPREISQLRTYLLSRRGHSDPSRVISSPRFLAGMELRVRPCWKVVSQITILTRSPAASVLGSADVLSLAQGLHGECGKCETVVEGSGRCC